MGKILLTFIVFIISFFSFPLRTLAQIVINEVSSVSSPEWVEIYNLSSSSASLKEYSIDFGSDNQKKFFCNNEEISPNGYKLITLTSNWLNNAGDVVNLRSGDDIVDSIGYGSGYSLAKPTTATDSITRSPDGSVNWIMTSQQSQQGDIVSFDCPSPTPISTPTPNPTVVPTPTLIPTPVKTSTPISTKSPTPKPTVSATPTNTPDPAVLGTSTIEPIITPTLTPTVEGIQINKPPLLAFILVALGVLFIGMASFLAFNKMRYNNLHEEKNNFSD